MPGTYFGPYEERNNNYAFEVHANLGRWPLGHRLVLPDGRTHRFALNDGTVEVAGNLYQSVVGLDDHQNRAPDVARAIGATEISATLTGTAAAVDIYSEGICHIMDTPGLGYAYRVIRAKTAGGANVASVASGVLTVLLDSNETVQVALTTGSNVTFSRNRFHQVLIHPGPPTGNLAGFSPGVCAADRFYWSQVSGESAALAQDTLLRGLPVQAGIDDNGSVESAKRRVTVTGTVTADATTGVLVTDSNDSVTTFRAMGVATSVANVDITGSIAANAPLVGMCLQPATNTTYGLIDINYLGW